MIEQYIHNSIQNVIGVWPHDGVYTLQFADGTSRDATAQEVADAQAALDLIAADEAERLAQLEAAKNAAAALQTIIDGIDAATLTQAKGAIKQLAQILKGTIRAVVGK